jgi:hypothetical protein
VLEGNDRRDFFPLIITDSVEIPLCVSFSNCRFADYVAIAYDDIGMPCSLCGKCQMNDE